MTWLAAVGCFLLLANDSAGEHGRPGPYRVARRLPPIEAPEAEAYLHAPATPEIVITSEPEPPEPDIPEPEGLEQAWAMALAVDAALQSQQLRTAAAHSHWRAAEAERYPWIDVGANYSVRSDEPAFVFSGQPFLPGNIVSPYAQREGIGYFAALSVPLYTGGGTTASIGSAEAVASASCAETRAAQRDLKLHVAQDYISVLRAGSEVELARATVRSLESFARSVELKFQQAQRPKNDLLAAQVALADARHAAIAAENMLDICRAAYNRRLGRQLDAPVRLQDLSIRRSAADVELLTHTAIAQREELAQIAAQSCSLRRQAEALIARNRPQAALTAGYAYNENRYQSPEGMASIGVGVTWNLYDAGRDRERACALHQQASALAHLSADMRSRIELEVRRAWLELDESLRRLSVTAGALAQADENVRVARMQYAEEMGTNTDVLAAERLRMQSFRNHHHAYYDAVLADFRLRRAIGDL